MSASGSRRLRWLRITLYTAGLFLLLVGAIALVLAIRFQPIARNYFISTLRKRYQSDVELGDMRISLYPAVRATGDHLVFWFHGRHDLPPLVRIRRFNLEAGFFNFFRTPKHIGLLRLEGLEIHLPPRSGQPDTGSPSPSRGATPGTTAFILDEVVADGTSLVIAPRDPTKNPLVFDIRRLTLRTIGAGLPMTFHAEFTNPRPPGLISSDGRFGPWNADRPVETPVSGTYTFREADLSVFKGIAGTLSSGGQFNGQLGRLEVRGATDVPDFALKIAGHPMPLHTDFQATVDGANGNTVLHPVHARLGRLEFEVSGAIDRGALETHKTILLEARTGPSHTTARLEDFLRLAVKSANPPMTGGIRFDTKVKIPPGEAEVVDRLQLNGTFGLSAVKFTSPDVQQKIAWLSHRAQVDQANSGADVTADFEGSFLLTDGKLSLPDLRFTVPGANVSLQGSYMLRSGALDFRGTAKLDATLSQMAPAFASRFLKPLDAFFSRGGAGTVLPIAISGTRGEPSFKLDIGRILSGQ